MGNCTDCNPGITDLCNGEKKPTSCVYSQYAISTLNVQSNEELSLILTKIGAYIQDLEQRLQILEDV